VSGPTGPEPRRPRGARADRSANPKSSDRSGGADVPRRPIGPYATVPTSEPGGSGYNFMSGFNLDLGQLPQGASHVRLSADSAALGLSPEGWPGQVVGDVAIERSGDGISVRGRLRTTAWLECFRCLKGFERMVETPFEFYADRSGTGRRYEEQELERDHYMGFHDGRRLDLTELAREALLIELPIAPHCREDCKGLCPRCGADLNDGPCACQDPIAET